MTGRRTFLTTASAALLGLPRGAGLAWAQQANAAGFAKDVTSFWMNQMEVPPELLVGGEIAGSRDVQVGGFTREPYFFYVDEKKDSDGKVVKTILTPAEEVPKNKLQPGGDAQVEMQILRLRLNDKDQGVFEGYQAGAIYIDCQQKTPSSQHELDLAWSVFSAIFPGIAGGRKPGPNAQAGAAAAGSTPAMQQAGEMQSLALPNGAGKAAFEVFAKDRRKTAFGMFISAFAQMTNMAQPSYLQLLSMPVIAAPALSAVRALVGNLQAHGGQHHWFLQSPPLDMAATQEAATASPRCLKLAAGQYVAIPKEHLSLMEGNTERYKIVDGFLVPNDVRPFQVYDWAQSHQSDFSYLSLFTNVKRAKVAPCSLAGLIKGA